MSRFLHLCVALSLFITPLRSQTSSPEELQKAGLRFNQLCSLIFSALPDDVRNVAISPWPIHRSLTLAFLGAQGDTRAEIGKAMQSEQPVADGRLLRQEILGALDRWMVNGRLSIDGIGGKVPVAEWNDLSALWVSPAVKGRPEYVAALAKVPGAKVSAIDFKSPGKTVVDINEWIATATRQRIPRLLSPGAFTPDTAMTLTSALYFSAPWTTQFKAEKTVMEKFLSFNVPTMVATLEARSLQENGVTIIGLPIGYAKGAPDFQLLLFVDDDERPTYMAHRLTAQYLQSLGEMKTSRIELHLPRFRIPITALALRSPLEALGMKKAFKLGEADFGAMASTPVALDEVFGACEFSIDENGVSGAAAAVIPATIFREVGPLPSGTVVRVNRPFYFALQHVPSRACLFLGRVVDPR